MTRRILKYELESGVNVIPMSRGAVLLSVAVQGGRHVVWALVDSEDLVEDCVSGGSGRFLPLVSVLPNGIVEWDTERYSTFAAALIEAFSVSRDAVFEEAAWVCDALADDEYTRACQAPYDSVDRVIGFAASAAFRRAALKLRALKSEGEGR